MKSTFIRRLNIILLISIVPYLSVLSQSDFDTDIVKTTDGDVAITCVGHGTLMLKYNDRIIHIDPTSMTADYSTMPKADLILITHEHGDHFDLKAIHEIFKEGTELILTKTCADNLEGISGYKIMSNGETFNYKNIKIEAVPAYNMKNLRPDNNPFHPKGNGNGYILSFGKTRIYVAGDTENIPEMKDLKNIDIAFLPMNMPYTMTPEMVSDAVKSFRPKIVYPYHFSDTNTDELVKLLADEKDIEVRIRNF